jgi:tRNA U38,U39,U40 pseudouridine synthase TruA
MLVGTFVLLGLDKISRDAVLEMLISGERKSHVEVAPSNGLFLHSVRY